MTGDDILNRIKTAENLESNLSNKFGLRYNPFPRSGIANIDDPDEITRALVPAYSETATEIVNYMRDALSQSSGQNKDDKYLSLIIQGEYGSGKTQTLMYMKSLFESLRSESFSPYVVYIDDPGQKLTELVGTVISHIGIENFRRYLWDIFIQNLNDVDNEDPDNRIRKNVLLSEILKIKGGQSSLFDVHNDAARSDEFSWESVSISYKYLLDKMHLGTKAAEQKAAEALFKKYLMKCFSDKFQVSTIAEYFYDVVTDNINVTKSWDNIITGNVKYLYKREVYLLKAVVEIIKKYKKATDFIILVDEFEEIATGRLKDTDLDNYLRNLRSLIDREKNWCSVFAMNAAALQKVKKIAAPLASRIGDRRIILKPLDNSACEKIVASYMKIARKEDYNNDDELYPFTEEAINALLKTKEDSLNGSPRFVVKSCYTLLQRAADSLNKGEVIDTSFVKEVLGTLIKDDICH